MRLLYVWSSLSAGHGVTCCWRHIQPLILVCSCTRNVRLILGCAPSWLVPPCTWWVARAVAGSLCQVSGPGLAGTDHTSARRQVASQRLKVLDLKGISSIPYRCLEARKTSKGCLISLVNPCFKMFKQITCIIWSNDNYICRREW